MFDDMLLCHVLGPLKKYLDCPDELRDAEK